MLGTWRTTWSTRAEFASTGSTLTLLCGCFSRSECYRSQLRMEQVISEWETSKLEAKPQLCQSCTDLRESCSQGPFKAKAKFKVRSSTSSLTSPLEIHSFQVLSEQLLQSSIVGRINLQAFGASPMKFFSRNFLTASKNIIDGVWVETCGRKHLHTHAHTH